MARLKGDQMICFSLIFMMIKIASAGSSTYQLFNNTKILAKNTSISHCMYAVQNQAIYACAMLKLGDSCINRVLSTSPSGKLNDYIYVPSNNCSVGDTTSYYGRCTTVNVMIETVRSVGELFKPFCSLFKDDGFLNFDNFTINTDVVNKIDSSVDKIITTLNTTYRGKNMTTNGYSSIGGSLYVLRNLPSMETEFGGIHDWGYYNIFNNASYENLENQIGLQALRLMFQRDSNVLDNMESIALLILGVANEKINASVPVPTRGTRKILEHVVNIEADAIKRHQRNGRVLKMESNCEELIRRGLGVNPMSEAILCGELSSVIKSIAGVYGIVALTGQAGILVGTALTGTVAAPAVVGGLIAGLITESAIAFLFFEEAEYLSKAQQIRDEYKSGVTPTTNEILDMKSQKRDVDNIILLSTILNAITAAKGAPLPGKGAPQSGNFARYFPVATGLGSLLTGPICESLSDAATRINEAAIACKSNCNSQACQFAIAGCYQNSVSGIADRALDWLDDHI
jgi:hypothetical protein